MGLEYRVQIHKSKLKNETNDDTFRRIQNPGTPQGHMSITSHFNVIKKLGQNKSNQCSVDSDKHD